MNMASVASGGTCLPGLTAAANSVYGKPRFTLPMSNHHPLVTLRGALKQKVYAAIWEAFNSEAASGKKTVF